MSSTPEPIDNHSRMKNALLALKEMRAKLEAMEYSKTEPIAIIGMGCRFPGGVNNLEEFWSLLHSGVDAVTKVPPERWDINHFYDPDPDAPGKMYVQNGSFLDQVDQFDAKFFGITPRETISMDPQQRLLLEVSWEALEYAGIAPEHLRNSQTGVFVGMTNSDYLQLLAKYTDHTDIDAYTATGTCFNAVGGRLSYTLGLQGPCMVVDTACSSSLVTVHLACQSLRSQECHLAIAGGVNLILSPNGNIATCRARMLSADGRCKTFDAAADGYGRGEGCGVVVLKRLSDAISDGDNILALIRGSAVNQDGPSSGLTVPNGPAQQAVIRKALDNAGLKPEQISYVEAHGTGTSLGDPMEVESLGMVLCQERSKEEPLFIGSVKTNIGHLESAAGVAGLIKVVLSLQHQQIPPHLHLQNPNPYLPWAELPVVIPTQLTPWPAGQHGRIAGLSSFGFSGTNAHVVVAEAPVQQSVPTQLDRQVHLLTLSAKTQQALTQLTERFETYLRAHPELNLADVCYTANTGRSRFAHRLAMVAASSTQICQQLQEHRQGQNRTGVFHSQVEHTRSPKVAFLFAGQGSQYLGMGRQLYQTQPTFRQIIERCDAILRPYLKQPLLSVLYSSTDNSLLNQTAYTQPALFAVEYALSELWRSWGVEPAAVLGHNLGEYVAACVAGVFSLEDGLMLVAERSRLMQGSEMVGSKITYASPRIDLISSVSGQLVREEASFAGYWQQRRMQQTTGFVAGIETLHKHGYEVFVEISPSQVLLQMGRQCLPQGVGIWLPSLQRGQDDWQQLLLSLASLSVHGVEVDWSGLDRDYERNRVPLPTYPFQRQRFWFEAKQIETSFSQAQFQNEEILSTSRLDTNQENPFISLVAKTTGLSHNELGLDMSLEGELGLDSIMMTQLMSSLMKLIPENQRAAFSSKYSLRDLMQLQTLREIMQVFEDWQTSSDAQLSVNSEDTVVVKPETLVLQQEEKVERVEILHGQYFHLLGYWLVNSTSLFCTLRLQGSFELDIAQQSWKDLLSRHPMLRSRFHIPAGATRLKDYQLQVLEEPTPPEILFTDLRHLDSDAKEQAIREELNRWLNYEWLLTQWPLHQFSVLRLEDSVYQLILGNEHLISDGLGNHIILREFMEIYRAHVCNEEPTLPPPTTLKDYAEFVRAMNEWQELEEEHALEEYTSSQGKNSYFWNPKNKTVDYLRPQFHTQQYCLGRERTAKLISLTRDWRLPINSLLLGAFVQALAKFEQSDKPIVIQIPTGGRVYPGVDASDVVSSFAQNLALSFAPPQLDENPQVLLNRIHSEVKNGIAAGIDRAQTRQIGITFRDNMPLEDGKIPEYSIPMFQGALKSNLYLPYTGHTHIQTQYGPLQVTAYQAGGINAAGTIDILQEIFDDNLYLFASYDCQFFEMSLIDHLMREYIDQIEKLISLRIQPPQATKSLPVLQEHASIESTLRQLIEEICQYRIGTDEIDKDLEADLGMDSLERIRIVTRLEKLYGKLDRRALLSCRSLQEMTMTLVQRVN